MSKTVYALSEDDRKWIQQLIRAEVQKVRNTPQRPRMPITEDDYLAPEVYVALTPGGGIPKIRLESDTGTGTSGIIAGSPVGQGNTPGKAECDIYKIEYTDTTPNLLPVMGVNRTVHNISTTAVAGNTWTLVTRDKYGSWVCWPGVSVSLAIDLWYKVTSLTISGPGYPCVLATTTDGINFTLGASNIYALRLPNNEVPELNHIYKAQTVSTSAIGSPSRIVVLGDQDGISVEAYQIGGPVTTVMEDVTTHLQFVTHDLASIATLLEVSNPVHGTARVNVLGPSAKEVDGSPSYTDIRTFEFDGDNFTLSQPSATIARLVFDHTLAYGTYTPTFTAGVNVTAVGTSVAWHYARIGSTVFVCGIVSVTITAANTFSQIRITLPIASGADNSWGVASQSNTNTIFNGSVEADGVNNEARVNFYSGSTSLGGFTVIFAYQIG